MCQLLIASRPSQPLGVRIETSSSSGLSMPSLFSLRTRKHCGTQRRIFMADEKGRAEREIIKRKFISSASCVGRKCLNLIFIRFLHAQTHPFDFKLNP